MSLSVVKQVIKQFKSPFSDLANKKQPFQDSSSRPK